MGNQDAAKRDSFPPTRLPEGFALKSLAEENDLAKCTASSTVRALGLLLERLDMRDMPAAFAIGCYPRPGE